MKLKGIIKKKCPDGETYIFRDGVAEVPGMYIKKKPVKITLMEFISIIKEIA